VANEQNRYAVVGGREEAFAALHHFFRFGQGTDDQKSPSSDRLERNSKYRRSACSSNYERLLYGVEQSFEFAMICSK